MENTVKTELYNENHVVTISLDFTDRVSSNSNSKWALMVAVLNTSSVVWTENIWWVFRVKPPFSGSFSLVWTGLNLICPLKVFLEFHSCPACEEVMPSCDIVIEITAADVGGWCRGCAPHPLRWSLFRICFYLTSQLRHSQMMHAPPHKKP